MTMMVKKKQGEPDLEEARHHNDDDGGDVPVPAAEGGAVLTNNNASEICSPITTHKNLPLLVLGLLGSAAAAAILAVGVRGTIQREELRFQNKAAEQVLSIETTWNDYASSGLWVHQACSPAGRAAASASNTSSASTSNGFEGMCSREEFQHVYQYIVASGLDAHQVTYYPNVTREFRAAAEAESAAYTESRLAERSYSYQGFQGVQLDPATGRIEFGNRTAAPFYFPSLRLEPLERHVRYIDYDLYSAAGSAGVIDLAVRSWEPVASPPYSRQGQAENHVFFLHPGFRLPNAEETKSMGVASIAFKFSSFLQQAAVIPLEPVSVYIYVTSPAGYDPTAANEDHFFGAAKVIPNEDGADADENGVQLETITEEEMTLQELRDSLSNNNNYWVHESTVPIAQLSWQVVVVQEKSVSAADLIYILIGTVVILVASICLALWLRAVRRQQLADLQHAAEKERAALLLENANEAARGASNLNEILAHEVRNPLSAAMSACSFLESTIEQSALGQDDPSRHRSAMEDLNVISSSLNHVVDLLRGLLEFHKSAANSLTLQVVDTDLLKDVFEPAKTFLHRKQDPFDFIIDCPQDLVIRADPMRLRQICLNLAGNSKKFVEKGFIRLRAVVVAGSVRILVEDSGPGIPAEKKKVLFDKFQQSLDNLNQGTGLGLSLCKTLVVDLMGGTITLDDDYHSGVECCPGTRFVIELNTAPIEVDDQQRDEPPLDAESSGEKAATTSGNNKASNTSSSLGDDGPAALLPEHFNVLVTDDDLVLRKLIRRSLQRVAPQWNISEAANGESAISMCETEQFDLIMMDQYMASIEKQLLGTEACRLLRSRGVDSILCGLSANDKEAAFVEAGADGFLLKPIPANQTVLAQVLVDLITKGNQRRGRLVAEKESSASMLTYSTCQDESAGTTPGDGWEDKHNA